MFGFQLPRAAVALDELAGQRAGLEPEHDLVRGLRDFREGAEREDDRRGRYGHFGLACRALPDGHSCDTPSSCTRTSEVSTRLPLILMSASRSSEGTKQGWR